MIPSPPSIRQADDEDAESWNRLVEAVPHGSFYLRYEWLAINRDAMGHPVFPLLALRDTQVVGVLPLVRVRSRLFGDILCSMPFVNHGGPVGEDEGVEDELVREACQLAGRLGCDRLEIRGRRPFLDLRTSTRKVSMVIDLPDSADDVWTGFRSKHRNNIKRAQGQGLRVESGGAELLVPFYQVMERGWRALGTPLYHRSYFEELCRSLHGHIRIFVVWWEGTPIATTLNGESDSRVEGLWAAQDPEHLKLNSNYELYWQMIEDACTRGFRSFSLGRSTAGSGAASFKARWGAVPQQLYWNHHLPGGGEVPELNPDNPRYSAAIAAWRRLPLFMTRTLGPPLARRIP